MEKTPRHNRILIVDDELGIREGCRRALEPYRYDVDVAATGHEGLEKLSENAYDLLLLDVMMPDISGLELQAAVLPRNPHMACIVITGYATVEMAVQAMKLGADDFIPKPFSDDHLLLAVERGLEKRRLQQEAALSKQFVEEATKLSQEKALLEELDEVKSTYMRQVAHELRAPVAAIESFMNLLLGNYGSPQEQRGMVERAAKRAHELLELVDDLLYLSRLKDSRLRAKTDQVAMEQILHEVLDLQLAQAREKRIYVHVNTTPCPPMLAEASDFRQLWTNLISNAIKYTPRGGHVNARLYLDNGDTVVGQVEDTGIGISKEDLPRMFEEFFRTNEAKAFTQHGTGLGLSIVQRIVRDYGGIIWVESDLGKGTRFTFHLPLNGARPKNCFSLAP